jgi:uncharacterized protein with von Willebrand factor type A (vWA) domain
MILDALAGLVGELRAVGLPISPTEHIDAAAALRHTDLADRPAVKVALAATLVKNAEHLAAFSAVFDLFFADRSRQSTADSPAIADDELDALLMRALLENNKLLLRTVASALVDQRAGLDPGRRVAGTYYLTRAWTSVDLGALLARLSEALGEVAAQVRVESLRAQLLLEIRARLVADRGAADVARTTRKPLPEDVELLTATRVQTDELRAVLTPLARKLASRLARNRRAHRSAPLDFRRTIRHAMSAGGIPVDLAFHRPHPSRPELMVLADISGSVATFATFTLQLVYALRSEFARVRTFAFVDGLAEVTALLERADDLTQVARALNTATDVWISGSSDYGKALTAFHDRHLEQVHRRTTVLILGDARSNFLPPRAESLAAVTARARAVYWLNPERRQGWNEGDSIIGRYAPHCTAVHECRTIRQLRAFVENLNP